MHDLKPGNVVRVKRGRRLMIVIAAKGRRVRVAWLEKRGKVWRGPFRGFYDACYLVLVRA